MSLLRDLQDLATDEKVSVQTLLLKARVLAARLGHADLEQWIGRELDGYPDDVELPAYRTGFGRILRGNFNNAAWHYPNIQIPAWALPEQARAWATPMDFRGSISVAGEFAANENVTITLAVSSGLNTMVKLFELMDCSHMWAEVPRHAFRALLDAVRAKVLQYALEIEKANPAAGEAGPGERPVPAERLQQIYQIVVYGEHNIIAPGAGNVTQQNLNFASGDFAGLRAALAATGLGAEDLTALEAAIRDDEADRPKKGLGRRVASWLGAVTAKLVVGAVHLATATGTQVTAELLGKMLLRYYGLG